VERGLGAQPLPCRQRRSHLRTGPWHRRLAELRRARVTLVALWHAGQRSGKGWRRRSGGVWAWARPCMPAQRSARGAAATAARSAGRALASLQRLASGTLRGRSSALRQRAGLLAARSASSACCGLGEMPRRSWRPSQRAAILLASRRRLARWPDAHDSHRSACPSAHALRAGHLCPPGCRCAARRSLHASQMATCAARRRPRSGPQQARPGLRLPRARLPCRSHCPARCMAVGTALPRHPYHHQAVQTLRPADPGAAAARAACRRQAPACH